MNKIEEAHEVLKELGLPQQKKSNISALTLLALTGLRNNSKWSEATQKSLTLTKDILEFVNKEYEQHFMPNTRESFRKSALLPFIKHRIVVLNPDDPLLKPSSSKTHYALSDLAFNVVKKYKTEEWDSAIQNYRLQQSNKNRLRIRNFKSIKDVELEISRVNVFIGKPNSGKSNLLEALTFFNFIQGRKSQLNEPGLIRYKTLDNLFYDRDLAREIEISIHTNLALLFYQSSLNNFVHIINPTSDFLKVRRKMLDLGLSMDEIGKDVSLLSKEVDDERYSSKYGVMGIDGGYFQTAQTSKKENSIRRYEFVDGASYSDSFPGYLKTYGENLFTIVRGNPKLLEWINAFYEEYKLEFLIDFSSKVFEIQKKEKGIVYKIPFELTPDTFRRMLFHIAAIYSNKNTAILFEEPESHSFPPYVKEFSELIKNDKNNNTYFITTHSPYFFDSMVEDSKKYKDISFFHVYYENFQTKVKKLTSKELDNIWGNGVDVFFNIDSFST